jgi:uncharacterized protein
MTLGTDDLTLAGHLRLPNSTAGLGLLPALVSTGPFTGVKEQVAGLYAQQLAERGFVTFAFDHRNFGASGVIAANTKTAPGKPADLSAAPELAKPAGRAGAGPQRHVSLSPR